MKHFIGVKLIQAELMTRGSFAKYRGQELDPDYVSDEPGYLVKYTDDFFSWCPKNTFEEAYFELTAEDGSTVSQTDIDRFACAPQGKQIDEKTLLVTHTTLTGFVQHEASSCVDPKNFNREIGIECGSSRIKNDLWKCMGFVLQWARFGLKNNKKKVSK